MSSGDMTRGEQAYCKYSDDELAVMAQGGDISAEEILMRKYKETVRIKSKMYYMAGADEDDIVQEGMIGLLKAIRQFDVLSAKRPSARLPAFA